MPTLPPKRAATVVIVGSINMDLVARVPRLPKPGETLAGTDFVTLPGGKGANQAVAVARLGGRAVMIGNVGDDVFGERLLRGLRQEGVDTRGVRTIPQTSSGVAVIAVEARGQNSIILVPGANHALRPEHIQAAERVIARADAVLVQLEIPLDTAAAALELARRHGVPTILDTAPVPPGGLPESLGSVDVLSPNQTEAALLTGRRCATREDAARVAEILFERHRPAAVVLKLGDQGASVHLPGGWARFFPPQRVKAVDTTAAGDAFAAALALRLAEGGTLDDALPWANAAGALAATVLGAQNAMPTRTQVQRQLRARRISRTSKP